MTELAPDPEVIAEIELAAAELEACRDPKSVHRYRTLELRVVVAGCWVRWRQEGQEVEGQVAVLYTGGRMLEAVSCSYSSQGNWHYSYANSLPGPGPAYRKISREEAVAYIARARSQYERVEYLSDSPEFLPAELYKWPANAIKGRSHGGRRRL